MKEGKAEYLCMVQEAISRMSTTSGILKGFSATVITGIAAISFTEVNKWVFLLSVFPIISFFALDVYYLGLERRFRFLFDLIRTDKKDIDFSMDIQIDKSKYKEAQVRVCDCLKSKSIWLFYPPAIVVIAIIVIMKFRGCI
ncbi:MAG: hypothetical protein GX434_12500 [Peptococcaceae bacterium]|nr:hypothetical protein [Peptococcaceae bacterium]